MTQLVFKFILGFAMGLGFSSIYETLPLKELFNREALVIFGFKLHHSLYGLILVVLGFFAVDQTSKVFLFSSGVGVIFQHYLTGGGLNFITKVKR